MKAIPTIRQGDVAVALLPIKKLPPGCVPVSGQDRKIVLAFGEVTGHHHRIEDHISQDAAREIAECAIARAKLVTSPVGDWYLEVSALVNLDHEEHRTLAIPPGIHELPVQVAMTTANETRRVAD